MAAIIMYIIVAMIGVGVFILFILPLLKKQYPYQPSSDELSDVKEQRKMLFDLKVDESKYISREIVGLKQENDKLRLLIKSLELKIQLMDKTIKMMEGHDARREWNEEEKQDMLIDRISKITLKQQRERQQ